MRPGQEASDELNGVDGVKHFLKVASMRPGQEAPDEHIRYVANHTKPNASMRPGQEAPDEQPCAISVTTLG